jgi:mitochondrial fission process protein 1
MGSTVEVAEDKVKELSDRDADSADSNIRYLAYGARLRTALRASTRYIAYVCDLNYVFRSSLCHESIYIQTSDVGEAFRPVVPPWVVTAGYGVSWLYLAG